MMRKSLAALAVLAGLSVATPAMAQGACTRESLETIADSWQRAVEQGTMMTMSLGEWVDYNGNGRRGSLGAFLDHPREVVHRMTLLDTTTCRTYNEIVAKNGDEWEVFGTQVNSGFFGTGPFVNVTTKVGDWLFDGERTVYYASKEDWGVIPDGQRNTRDEIMAAANAYLDLFSNPDTVVPWGTPCARLEGSVYTGRGEPTDSCNVGVPSGIAMADRDYVVDVERGAVAVFLKMGENRRPDIHTFRIEDGKIRYVHTITNCGGQDNCGFDPFSEMLARNPDMHPELP